MATDEREREVDRKVNTQPGTEDVDDQPPGDREDLRPDFDHFDSFADHASGLRDRIPGVPGVPGVPVVGVVMASLYAFVAAGALSVGYGATSLAATHGGTHVAYIVGGVFVFTYAYVGLRLADAATTGIQE